MPHDVNGNLLQPGDRILIRGTVTKIYSVDEYCNVEIELDHPMPPNKEKSHLSAINTRQIEKDEPNALELGAAVRQAGLT